MALLEKNFHVVIVAPPDEYSSKLKELGCGYFPVQFNNKGKNPFLELRTIFDYFSIYSSIQPSLILHYTPKPNIYGSIAARFLGVACINNVAGLGSAFAKEGILSLIVKHLYRFSQKSVRRVFFQNKDDMKMFVTSSIVTPQQADLLPGSGVELEKFSPREKTPSKEICFLLIARLIWEKGVGEFVDAARLVRSVHPEARFQILGYIDDKNPGAIPEKTIHGWVSEGLVEWIGRQEDVRPFIAEADCVVLPSYYREGTPRTLLEAASMAKPLIAADSIGCREPVDDGVNGFLCRPRDPADLASKMNSIIEMGSAKRQFMGRQGRIKMEVEYDSAIVTQRYVEAISSLFHDLDRTQH